ncbi:STAS domain-containing protein [Tundrisphaera sp. TA3]|uniref:STAS domain-containing protein n=1 Tax=Tundrisphaera sp. TA3 TaxID=3435775 RepID=UPI003EBFD33F
MPPPNTREQDGVLILKLDDLATVNDGQAIAPRQAIYQVATEGDPPRVAIDLTDIDFLSSSGVAMLIGLKRRVEAKAGRLVLFGLHPYVMDLFHVMKLAELFQIAPGEADAIALLSSSPVL